MPQTSYSLTHRIATPGMIADASPHDIRTAINADVVSLPLGIAVKFSTAAGDEGVATIGATTDPIAGIGVYSDTFAEGYDIDSTGVKVGTVFGVLEKGAIYVTVEEAVNAGDRAFVRFAAGAGGTQPGAFRKSADTASARQMQGAMYRTSAAAGGLAILVFDATTDRDVNN